MASPCNPCVVMVFVYMCSVDGMKSTHAFQLLFVFCSSFYNVFLVRMEKGANPKPYFDITNAELCVYVICCLMNALPMHHRDQ